MGRTLQSLYLDGHAPSVVLGCPEFGGYLETFLHHGAIVGPVANRIAGGRFSMEGRDYALDRNENDVTTLHGGAQGFGQRNWRLAEHGADFCTLALTHPDGLGGFPGPLEMRATYRLRGNALELTITGTAMAAAQFNSAFHGYWNLDGSDTVLGHSLTIAADRYTPVDARMIPTGVAPVEGTAFDYRTPRLVAPDIDHNLCCGDARGPLRPVCTLSAGGLAMTIETTEPGLQVYSAGGNRSGRWPGLDGKPFGAHKGIALEPQLWPDAPNRPTFPQARIEAGQTVTQHSRYVLTRT